MDKNIISLQVKKDVCNCSFQINKRKSQRSIHMIFEKAWYRLQYYVLTGNSP